MCRRRSNTVAREVLGFPVQSCVLILFERYAGTSTLRDGRSLSTNPLILSRCHAIWLVPAQQCRYVKGHAIVNKYINDINFVTEQIHKAAIDILSERHVQRLVTFCTEAAVCFCFKSNHAPIMTFGA